MGIVTCPDILSAFLAWVAGRALEDCRALVDRSRRLFRNCLRIVGWNHTLGGVTKAAGTVTQTWPDILHTIQRLCTFLRNETWRGHLRKEAMRMRSIQWFGPDCKEELLYPKANETEGEGMTLFALREIEAKAESSRSYEQHFMEQVDFNLQALLRSD